MQELETDEQYVLSGEKYPVAFEYAGQDTAKVEIKVNHGEPIENNLKYGKISGWKVDQDGFGLGGSKIGLFRAGETEFTEETALMVTESNPIGYFEFNKVPAGSWEIHEITPPKAFVLNEEIFPAEITEDGETIEITIQMCIRDRLKYNAQTGKYETTLTDSNGVLSEFSFSQPGVSFARTGNQLKISSEKTSFSTVSGEKKLPSSIAGVVKGASRYWLNENYQNVVTFEVGGEPLPVKAYFGLEVKAGHLKIVKTSEDGKVSGLSLIHILLNWA